MIDLGTIVGGLIAGLVGLAVTLCDRHLEKRRISQNWHRRIYRLSVRLRRRSTEQFGELSNSERNRLIAQYGSISDRIEDEITKVPPKSNLKLLSECETVVVYCDRMKINQDNRARQHHYHSKMLERAEEIQYLAENGFPESYPTDMVEEKKEEVEARMIQEANEVNE